MTQVVAVSELTTKYDEIEARPHSAGKSTPIKILCTLADPTSGTARVAGQDVPRAARGGA